MDLGETIATSDLKGTSNWVYKRYVSIEGQGNFFTIFFPGFVCFVLY